MIQNKLIRKDLEKLGIFNGFKYNNQFQLLKDNYSTRFLIDGFIVANDTALLSCDMLMDDTFKSELLKISKQYNIDLYVIDYYDWTRNDITIETKHNRSAWSTNNLINNRKIN